MSEIPDIIDLCEELGVNWSMLYNFIPTGRGSSMESMDLTPEQGEDLLKLVWNRMKTSRVNILSTAPQFARMALQTEGASCNIIPTHFSNSELPGELKSLSDFIGGCGAGRFYVAMNVNGNLTPRVFFPHVLGNIFKDDLDMLWQKNHSLQQLRDREQLKGHCGQCEYRYVCGGCRVRAYSYFGDYTRPDPGCILNRSACDELSLSYMPQMSPYGEIATTHMKN